MQIARPGFLGEPRFLENLHKDCLIWRKAPNLEVPRLPGLVPRAQIPNKIAAYNITNKILNII